MALGWVLSMIMSMCADGRRVCISVENVFAPCSPPKYIFVDCTLTTRRIVEDS